ncbi:hypothetical protein ABZV58_18285 [Nocardia sp. NPDC004654]|uniref:hypothetical protein n=1 Tax=Nocardia sp. NPDC004654 TaxID=3154776 RepID=UPI0033BAFCE6
MSVADDSALITLAETPTYGYVLLRQLAVQRHILVVPSMSLMAARRFAVDGDFSELFAARGVVRWVELDIETADRIAADVPIGADPTDWPLIAPVVWSARQLQRSVMTQRPERYTGYDVEIEALP